MILFSQFEKKLRETGKVDLRKGVKFSFDEERWILNTPTHIAKESAVKLLSKLFLPQKELSETIPRLPTFFIDGTYTITRIREMKVLEEKFIAPIDVAQIIVGATKLVELENSKEYKIVPENLYHIFLILGPFKVSGIDLEEIIGDKIYLLDSTGNFEEKICSQKGHIKIFYSDTSLDLKYGSSLIHNEKRYGYGYFVRRAFNRARIIMRILEGMMYLKIIEKSSKELEEKNSYVLMDGPPLYLSQYARLISPSISSLFEVKSEDIKKKFYSKFKYLIGLTKHIKINPPDSDFLNFVWGFNLAEFSEDKEILIYWMPDIVEGIGGYSSEEIKKIKIGKMSISAFFRLRHEIIKKFLSYYPYFGMVKLDILIPTIVTEDVFDKFFDNLKGGLEEDYDSYNKENDKDAIEIIRNFLQSSEGQKRMKEIIRGLEILSWPLPPKSVDPHRWASTVYPIAQTEKWIKSQLWDPVKVKFIFEHEDVEKKYLTTWLT